MLVHLSPGCSYILKVAEKMWDTFPPIKYKVLGASSKLLMLGGHHRTGRLFSPIQWAWYSANRAIHKPSCRNKADRNDRTAVELHPRTFDLCERHDTATSDSTAFRVMTYNILASALSTPTNFPYAPESSLSWNTSRKWLVLQEIESYSPDILCLQEVESEAFEFLLQELGGYSGHLSVGKKLHTTAILYKTNSFRLVSSHDLHLNDLAKEPFRRVAPRSNHLDTPSLAVADDTATEALCSRINDLWGSSAVTKPSREKKCHSETNSSGDSSPPKLASTSPSIAEQWLPGPSMKSSRVRQRHNLFWNTMKCTRNNAQAVVLEARHLRDDTGRLHRLCVSNAHLYWDPKSPEIKSTQMALLLRDLSRLCDGARGSSDPTGGGGGGAVTNLVYSDLVCNKQSQQLEEEEGLKAEDSALLLKAMLGVVKSQSPSKGQGSGSGRGFLPWGDLGVKGGEDEQLATVRQPTLQPRQEEEQQQMQKRKHTQEEQQGQHNNEERNEEQSPGRLPLLLCGDFNSIPCVSLDEDGDTSAGPQQFSGVYELLRSGGLPTSHPHHPNTGTSPAGLALPPFSHPFPLQSAYLSVAGYEPATTNHTSTFSGTLDYIWFTAPDAYDGETSPPYPESHSCAAAGAATTGFQDPKERPRVDREVKLEAGLQARAVLEIPSIEVLSEETALPSSKFPSDHISLVADMAFTSSPSSGDIDMKT